MTTLQIISATLVSFWVGYFVGTVSLEDEGIFLVGAAIGIIGFVAAIGCLVVVILRGLGLG